MLQEPLTNVRRHSRARKVSVVLKTEGKDMIAEVSDDRQGFGLEKDPGVDQGCMRERAAAGELQFESEQGRGTRVRLRASLPREVRK